MKEKKLRKFTVRLLKKDKKFEDSCRNIEKLKCISRTKDSSIYLIQGNKNEPWWVEYLEIEDKLLNSSNSAIFTICVESRIFVYTFGFAYTKLKPEYYEENFGFFVTINSIDGEKLKSIDTYSPANNTKQKKEISSILSNIYEYDFNENQDLIQKLSGIIKPEYKDYFTNPTGADSLSIYSRSFKSELKNVSEKLFERFSSEDYKKDPYLKNINKINKADTQQVEELNSVLINKLNSKDFSNIYMADYEILDNFYSYKFEKKEFINLSIENLDLKNSLKLEDLKTLKISVLKTENDQNPIQWSLYKCLVFDHNNTFLSKGIVYEVKNDFLNEVNNFINKYRTYNFLSEAKKIKNDKEKYECEKEEDYNKRICDNSGNLILLDRKCVNIEGYSPIEICDIYDKTDQKFIHIKKATCSVSLSHLWNQGIVSEQLANSKNMDYIDKFEKETSLAFPEKNRKIYYGIIKNNEELPIFSRISLYNSIKILRSIGKSDDEIKYFYIGISNDK